MALPVRRHQADATVEAGTPGPVAEAIRWDPFAEIDRLTQQLQGYVQRWAGGGFTPLADVEEADDAYTAEIELPGVKRDDVSVEVSGRRLTVTAERKERERAGILRRRTRVAGRFHYEVVLPAEVDEEGVTASLDEGVLTVRLPKPAALRPRRIPIG